MLTEKQISALRAAFPDEALSADTSRGFELTSIKAAYVVERLNEVFGVCGCGWRYVHSPFEWIEGEVLTEVALQFHVAEGGVNAVVWDSHGWNFVAGSEAWSWPIFSAGGRRPNKGNTPMTDARKGAITDGLTKAASMIGVGHDVFKGLVRGREIKTSPKVERSNGSVPKEGNGFEPRLQPVMPRRAIPVKDESVPSNVVTQNAPTNGNSHSNGATNGNGASNGGANGNGSSHGNGATNGANDQVGSTAFWLFANSDAAKIVDRGTISALAKTVVENKGTWKDALTKLKAMADGTATTKTLRLMETSDPLDMLFK